MDRIVLTADLHLGHANILRHCLETRARYRTVDEMNSAYLAALLAFKGSRLLFLGDLSMNRRVAIQAVEFLRDTFSSVVFVMGNHDKRPVIEGAGFTWHGDLLDMPADGQRIVLCHYPFESWAGRSHGSIHFHGHSHCNSREVQNRLDVGIDNAVKLLGEPRPFTLEEALELARRER